MLCTKRRICSPELHKLGMAVQAYTHSTQEAETKGPEGEALLSYFEASPKYLRPCFKRKKKL